MIATDEWVCREAPPPTDHLTFDVCGETPPFACAEAGCAVCLAAVDAEVNRLASAYRYGRPVPPSEAPVALARVASALGVGHLAGSGS